MRIWFPNPLGDDVLADLQSLVPGDVVSRDPAPDSEMLIEGRVTREQLEAAPNLRYVVIPFAGVSPATVEVMSEFPNISVHNLHHNAPDTAETALALLLAAAKQTVPMDQALRRNDWSPRYTPEEALLLEGRTCVILGYGEVGKRIGRMVEAIGMHVVGISRSGEHRPEHLHQILPRADVLMIAIPLTPETHGLIGQAEIDLMPEASILINVARAQIVDEQALYDGLKSGHLHSAGLDVWYRYPKEEGTAVPTYFVAPPSAKNTPPTNLPFHELTTLVMSPHRGGATRDTETRRVRHLARLVAAASAGEPVPNHVRLELGY